ncbi:MAG: hypothetical protein II711_01755 [Clostridia bacterium]|nr:hypothetical protein [Clostridia bacterium]
MPLDYDDEWLKKAAAKKLKVSVSAIESVSLCRRSVDARKKNNVHFQAAVNVKLFYGEKKALSQCKNAVKAEEYHYQLPYSVPLDQRPVVVGTGPCGLFAALILAQSGQRPIVVERGCDIEKRTADVALFHSSGILNTASNIQFGEGGAGTFSDGKLQTGTKDSRIRKVLTEFAAHGAPNEILYLAKPHIGTDMLKETVKSIRETIVELGGEVLFETQLVGIKSKNGSVSGAAVMHNGKIDIIPTRHLILAVGHSARDTFAMLLQKGIAMEQKPFAMGVRIEHLQESINRSQYGSFYNSPYLSAADYKLALHLNSGRGVYTFCMCPGGTVVAAASEEGHLVTNGMSEFARNKINANSALLVGINTADFGSDDILAGIKLQQKLERSAFLAGGSNYHAPVQRVCDFVKMQKSSSLGAVVPSYRPGVELTNLDNVLPQFMTDALREGIIGMDQKLKGFANGDAVLTAVESRSSSPVRILRDETMQSVSMKGLYPCGEGAGFAGGIVSAAVDGIKAAEQILLLSAHS